MKKIIFLPFLLTLCSFFACGDSTKTESTNTQVVEQEVNTLDSISTEIDEVTTEIEEKTQALEDALKDL